MKFIKNILVKEIADSIKDYPTVEITVTVPPVQPTMNRKCMFNVVNELKAKRCVAILEVAGINDAIAHYLCLDAQGGIYDPTLGWPYSGCKYKLIRYIHPDDECINNMSDTLGELKKKLYKMASWKARFLAKLFFIDYCDVV